MHGLKGQPYVDGSRIGLWGLELRRFHDELRADAQPGRSRSASPAARFPTGATTIRSTPSVICKRRRTTLMVYWKSSPVHYAKDLHGKLLLIHGAIDDNVHVANTMQFLYELQKSGSRCS